MCDIGMSHGDGGWETSVTRWQEREREKRQPIGRLVRATWKHTFARKCNLMQVGRTIWSSCVEAALEYVRLVNDLYSHSPGTRLSNIMLAAAGQADSEATLVYKWGSEQVRT